MAIGYGWFYWKSAVCEGQLLGQAHVLAKDLDAHVKRE